MQYCGYAPPDNNVSQPQAANTSSCTYRHTTSRTSRQDIGSIGRRPPLDLKAVQSGAQRTRLLHDSPFLQGFDSGRSYTASRNATRGTDLHDWKLSAVPRTLPVSLKGSCRWQAIAGLRRLLVSRETSFWASEDQWTNA